MDQVLVYGANGYTGALVARLAASRGDRPILAGRSDRPIRALAEELGLPHRVFGLDDAAAVHAGIDGVRAVLHCAGPFSATSAPMVDACLAAGAHYLDITGEIAVFQAVSGRDDAGRSRGVTLLPGVGFDVVPTDSIAAHLAGRLPSATHLTLAFTSRGPGGISHGSAATVVERLGRPGMVRRGGALVEVPQGSASREIDFGFRTLRAVRIPWGDVFTAYHTTGIPNVEVYTTMPGSAGLVLRALRAAGPLFSTRPVKRLLGAWLRRMPPGPTSEQRAKTQTVVWGEARDADGTAARARLTGPDGYSFTAETAWAAVRAVLAGEASPGFQTPGGAFGADWVLGLPGVSREDVA